MASRQAEYVRRVRQELLDRFGNKCALCPETRPKKLEFDHIHGRDYIPSKLSSSARMARYKREAEAGLLRLLCGTCNLSVRKTNDAGQHIPTNAVVLRTAPLEEAA